jgi:hypothetical protein
MANFMSKKVSKMSAVIPGDNAWVRFALMFILFEYNMVAHVNEVPHETGSTLHIVVYTKNTKRTKKLVFQILLENDLPVSLNWSIEKLKDFNSYDPRARVEGAIQEASSSEQLILPFTFWVQSLSTVPNWEITPPDRLRELRLRWGAAQGRCMFWIRLTTIAMPKPPLPLPVVLYLCQSKHSVVSRRCKVTLNEHSLYNLIGFRKELASVSGCRPFNIALVLFRDNLQPVTHLSHVVPNMEFIVVMVGYKGRITKDEIRSEVPESHTAQKTALEGEMRTLKCHLEIAKSRIVTLESEKISFQMQYCLKSLMKRKELQEAGYSEAESEQIINIVFQK